MAGNGGNVVDGVDPGPDGIVGVIEDNDVAGDSVVTDDTTVDSGTVDNGGNGDDVDDTVDNGAGEPGVVDKD